MYDGFRTIPWLTEGAIEFLKGFVKPETKVLEFGCGGSTIWMSQIVHNLITVEHDEDWYNKIKDYIIKHEGKADIRRMDLPYHGVLDEFPDEHFDLIIVDGRRRVECAKAAMPKVKKEGFLMLDNAERKEYDEAFKALYLWEMNRTTQNTPDSLGYFYNNWQTCWWKKPKKGEID